MFNSFQDAELALEKLKAQGRKVDMTRGKPGPDQLDLTDQLFSEVPSALKISRSGEDIRNYGGGVAGLIEARELMAPLMGISPEQTIVLGNSSLQLMANFMKFRVLPAALNTTKPKFLAPVPGYDRHYTMTATFGLELIPVPFNSEGPDMDICEELVSRDPNILGGWFIPKHSNPSGHTYSEHTIARIAALPRLSDGLFQIMWDNAYAVHDLRSYNPIASVMAAAESYSTEDSVAIFASTSKITYAGSGLASIGLSPAQFDSYKSYLEFETIGPDKINQLRHVHALRDFNGILSHMNQHAEILRPRFAAVTETLEAMVGGLEGVEFNLPEGGYFIDLNVPGHAKEIVGLCGQAGVKLTPAGAAFPYGDPKNGQIRIAPSYPTPEEIKFASEVVGTAIYASILKNR